MVEAELFWIFGGLAVALAFLVIVFPNPVNGAVALIGNLFCVAALFALLDAHFLAVIQVLLYAGAILVLFLFVIMLLNLGPDELGRARKTLAKGVALLLLLVVGFITLRALTSENIGASAFGPVPADFGTLESVGRLVFGPYLLPFEVTSVLLLAAILGSVAIAKKTLR